MPNQWKIRNKRKPLKISESQRMFYEKHLNTEHSVLFEYEKKDGYLLGFTENSYVLPT